MKPPPERDDAAALAGAAAPDDTGQDRNLDHIPPLPLYALIDRRRNGLPRIVGEYSDPKSAHDAAIMLRWAGDPVEIVLMTAVRGEHDV